MRGEEKGILFYNFYILTANYVAIFLTTTTVSTYLLRKQAAAVEGGNRRVEAETRGAGGFRGRQRTNRERERQTGRRKRKRLY